ncbi:MAG: DNA gyrase subunit A, partial [Propioniciclava sp.]
ISGVQNLTDRHHGMRLVVELKHGFNPEAVLAQLYKFTPLEDSFGINNVALVDGQPRTLGLKELLQVFLNHRIEVVRRRSEFRLNKAQRDLHLVDGLLIAVLNIDEVIAVIRSSDDTAAARERLQQVFELSPEQADYILELRLRRLTKYSQIELEQRRTELLEQIASLEEILGSEAKLHGLVSSELADVAKAFGTARRTILLESDGVTGKDAMTAVPLEVEDGPCWVMLSGTGLIARTSDAAQPSREGRRVAHDALVSIVAGTVRGQVGVVTNLGVLHRLDVLLTPTLPATTSAPSLAGGVPLKDLLPNLEKNEVPLALVNMSDDAPPLALVTKNGKIKRTVSGYPARDSFEVISLSDKDEVVAAAHASDSDQLVLVNSDAQLLRFGADVVRPQGRTGQGVAGIRLAEGAQVLCLGVVASDDIGGAFVATISGSSTTLAGTSPGAAKVTPLDRFPAKGRGTGGVRAQRFLRGEDCLTLAYGGVGPLRAVRAGGQRADLPEVDERRDGSGVPLTHTVAAIG